MAASVGRDLTRHYRNLSRDLSVTVGSIAMAFRSSRLRCAAFWLMVLAALFAGCSNPDLEAEEREVLDTIQLTDPPRRYVAEWLINLRAVDREDIAATTIYREIVDDLTGSYLVQAPRHLAVQQPEEVVFCAAIDRIPLDPFCAASPRAEGSPNVLAFPVQIIQADWSPNGLYDLAGYREVSLVAASEPASWTRQTTQAAGGFPIECFLLTGDSSAASTGFEICYTDDEFHLVASVDLQNDLIFEIELLRYEPNPTPEDFETGLEEFFENRPELQEQLLDLYPEIPAARPTPTPVIDE